MDVDVVVLGACTIVEVPSDAIVAGVEAHVLLAACVVLPPIALAAVKESSFVP